MDGKDTKNLRKVKTVLGFFAGITVDFNFTFKASLKFTLKGELRYLNIYNLLTPTPQIFADTIFLKTNGILFSISNFTSLRWNC